MPSKSNSQAEAKIMPGVNRNQIPPRILSSPPALGVWQAGYLARKNGSGRLACPYDSNRYKNGWLRGWEKADAIVRHAAAHT